MVLQGKEEEESTKTSHHCAECKRSFSSGKALGGHFSSAHVQVSRDHKSHRETSSPMGKSDIICTQCKKGFPSRKSLYGHMRCHPEREWRGMKPPEPGHPLGTGNSNSGSSVGSNTSCLKYKHEVPAINPNPSVTDSERDENIVDNVQKSLKFVNDDKSRGPDFSDAKGEGEGKAVCKPGTKMALEFSKETDNEPDNKKIKSTEGEEIKGFECLEITQENSKEPSQVNEDSAIPVPLKLACRDCGKEFSTHYALGGHVASHMKMIVRVHNTADHVDNEAAPEKMKKNKRVKSASFPNNIESGNTATARGEENNKYFDTLSVPEGQETCNCGEIPENTETAHKKGFDFDLNEMPDEED